MLRLIMYILIFLGTLLYFFVKYLFKFIFVGLKAEDGEDIMVSLILDMELNAESIFYKVKQKKKI